MDTVFFEYASDEQLDYMPPLIKHVYDTFESRIRVHALPNTKALTGADPAKQARRARTLSPILQAQFTRGRAASSSGSPRSTRRRPMPRTPR